MTWAKKHVGLIVVSVVGIPLCSALVIRGDFYGFIIAGLLGWGGAIYDMDRNA